MKYGSIEYRYAEPIARHLADDAAFRRWVLSRSKFSDYADAKLLKDEMFIHRRNKTSEWWRFHFSMCKCEGCIGGRETDIFAVFEAAGSPRFGMHFEVKQPTDSFKKSSLQDHRYPIRAACWVVKPPERILPHRDASTGIFFSEVNRSKIAEFLGNFGTQITFEEIEREFPRVAEWHQSRPTDGPAAFFEGRQA